MFRATFLLIAALTASYGLSRHATAEPLVFTATLEPAQSTAVYAAISGIVERVAIQEGDHVATGDTLALLDATELRLIEESARIALQKTRNQLSRMEPLHAKGGISSQDLESLQYDSEQARIRWQRAHLDLDRATLLAPMIGIIAECLIHPGDLTTPRLLLFTIIVPRNLKAVLFIPADQLASIRLNQSVTASSLADSTQTVNGTITSISPVINPESGTCRALAIFPNTGRTIKPGTVARVHFNQE